VSCQLLVICDIIWLSPLGIDIAIVTVCLWFVAMWCNPAAFDCSLPFMHTYIQFLNVPQLRLASPLLTIPPSLSETSTGQTISTSVCNKSNYHLVSLSIMVLSNCLWLYVQGLREVGKGGGGEGLLRGVVGMVLLYQEM